MMPESLPAGALSRRAVRLVASALAALALAGCSAVGPAYRAPTAPLPPAYAGRVAHEGSTVDLVRWWQGFGDPQLAALIEEAQFGNPTVGQAVARIAQARALVTIAGAQLAPQLDARVGGSRATQFFFTGTGPTIVPATTIQAGLEASWEFDLFGRVLRGQQAAAAQLESTERNWHEARASVAAEVARAYVQARACRARRDTLNQQLGSVREDERIGALRAQAGRIASAELAQTRASLAEVQARLADAQARCSEADAALAELTGQSVAQVGERLSALPVAIPAFSGGPGEAVPADLLRQRPDVAAAERRLAAASARIGEAQAAQYPSFSITGALSLNRLSALGQDVNYRSWSIAPGLRLPLLDGRRRRAQVEQREAEYQEAYEAYRAQVARAVSETEAAIGDLAAARDRVVAVETAVREYDQFFRAEQARLRAGRTATVEVERARRALLQAVAAEVDAREGLAVGWVRLYRALGGGWQQAGTADTAAR